MRYHADLLALAQKIEPANDDVAYCWSLLLEGIKLGWVDQEGLRELDDSLAGEGGWGTEELIFSNIAGELRVDFVTDQASCPTADFAEALTVLLSRLE